MNAQALIDTGRAWEASGKGLLAIDDGYPICNQRFAQIGDSPKRGGAARLSGVDCAGT